MVSFFLKAVLCSNLHSSSSLVTPAFRISSFLIVIAVNVMLGLEGILLLVAIGFRFHQHVQRLVVFSSYALHAKVTGRHYALPMPPELPQFRYDTSTRPFSNVGIDFAGPLTVKDRSGMHIKGYICLLTCLTTHAINLEIVEDLSRSSFLQALRHHCSLFSMPHLIRSDNAQTFKRAEKDLQILLLILDRHPYKLL